MAKFQSFVQAGFECATHRNLHKQRLDIAASSRHTEFLAQDYGRLQECGIATVREGARWHVIEYKPRLRDFSSLDAVVTASQEAGVELILDLMHFGWPDFLDIFSPGFVHAFESFTLATTRFLKRRGLTRLSVVPINEISFLSWAGGDQALLNPHARGRGAELKRQLVKAAIAASKVIRNELPSAMLVTAEPVIHIVPRDEIKGDDLSAERHRLAMYEATDMLMGRSCPELGGSMQLVDVVGVNFYDRNQWVHHSHTLTRADARYRPFRQVLQETWERYRKPVLVTETGTEDEARADWFSYVCDEVRAATHSGIPVEGVCLYPILNHPGWDDGRHCHNGLWDYADDHGQREMHHPLGDAIAKEHSRRRMAAQQVA